jgi:long-chain acyl-CoA synthetase
MGLKTDEVGELIVKGSGVMKGYYKNPEATAQIITNGWLHTGDLGRIDKDGFMYIVDRKKDLIICGGENVYPVEIEATLQKHPKVHDVAVIGIPDDRLGEVIVAVIQSVPGKEATLAEMVAYCEENLPSYKRPRQILFSEIACSLREGRTQRRVGPHKKIDKLVAKLNGYMAVVAGVTLMLVMLLTVVRSSRPHRY